MTVLVDSDVLIDVSRGRPSMIVSKWEELSESDFVVLYSPVSVAELWAGARSHEHNSLTQLFGALTCSRLDSQVAQKAGTWLRQYRMSHSLEIADALIAACAFAEDAVLWTRNRKHYPMPELTFFE